MTKRIALAAVFLTAAAGTGWGVQHPDELAQYARAVAQAALLAWDKIEANPVPVVLAAGTFLLTVVYYKARGKSLRESLAVAATRVTTIAVPARDARDEENAVIRRAKARAMRTQLLTDQIGIENRQRKLPDEVQKAEKEACYTEQALADARRALAEKEKAHEQAVAKLDAIRKVVAEGKAELAEIQAELEKLADLV